MMRLRAVGVGITLLIAAAWPLAGVPAIACATEGPRAALVVDDGSAVTELCVALDAPTVSGTRLIELAHAQHGLAYSLGFGGQAVCMLNGVGTTSGDCFADYPDFWGYWHGDGDGEWVWGSSAAATFDVANGDIEGWVFGSGDSGTTHDRPPPLASGDVCPVVADPSSIAPSAPPDGGGSDEGIGGSSTGGAASGDAGTQPGPVPSGVEDATVDGGDHTGPTPAAGGAHGEHGEPSDLRRRADEPESPSAAGPSSPETGQIRASFPLAGGRAGPPPGMLVAIALGTLLGGAGWWRLRRARQPGETNRE
jgi:hypothetical protein